MNDLEKRIKLLEERLALVSTYTELSLELLANRTDIDTMNKLYELNDKYNDVWESLEKDDG